jgi:hypothetical protein
MKEITHEELSGVIISAAIEILNELKPVWTKSFTSAP